MQPQKIAQLIDSSLALRNDGDSVLDVDAIVREVLAHVPPGDDVDPGEIRKRVMSLGIHHAGMRW